MKTATRVWLIIAACLVLIGGAIFVGGMRLAHWDFASFGSNKLVTNTYVISDSFRSISIEGETEDIAFLRSDDGRCRVMFYESEQQKHTAVVQDGTLKIGVIDTGEWRDHLFGSGSPTITVLLPAATYDALTIGASTGDVTLPGDFTFGSISIDLSTGSVACSASATGTIDVETGTGSILLSDVSAGAVKLTVSTGRIEVSRVTCAGAVSVGVSSGKAFLTGVTCESLVSTGDTGAITLTDVVASGAMTIERTTGDVTFERCDAAELTVRTDTGDVTGTLRSAKVFITNSNTGQVDVPESITGGKCKITTSTGDIRISIG